MQPFQKPKTQAVMAKKNKAEASVHGIIPYAKQSGVTSFSSLWSIKHSLNTTKVGHTGTLDSFAEGLLVCACGNLTHLVPHITSFTKTYEAVVCLGKTTESLDPCSPIVDNNSEKKSAEEKKLPAKEDLISILPKFTGALLQVPPAFSALHVDGKRASDLVREGKEVTLEPREIFVYKNELLDFLPCEKTDGSVCYALLRITCSKGTYIRSLARDIAQALGTEAYLCALRRTQVGPFLLKDAALAEKLPDFTIQYGIKNEEFIRSLKGGFAKKENDEKDFSSIRGHLFSMTPELASSCGFSSFMLEEKYESSYKNGRPLKWNMFREINTSSSKEVAWKNEAECAAFYKDFSFAGMMIKGDTYPKYGFVVHPQKKEFPVFTWNQIEKGEFPVQWKNQGAAVSVGSFDGMHAGHLELVRRVKKSAQEKNLRSGIVTFREPSKIFSDGFSGSVGTLCEKINFCKKEGLDFAVVIDFSPDFSKIDGTSFMQNLVSFIGLKFLAEGEDFRCGYKGSLSMKELPLVAEKNGFELCSVKDVELLGGRVSSSRIRDSLLKGDISSANQMLSHEFAYDCQGLSWTDLSSENGFFVAQKCSNQVLPKTGEYKVMVKLSGDGALKDSVELNKVPCDTLHTSCRIENERLCLSLPTLSMAKRVQTIIFL